LIVSDHWLEAHALGHDMAALHVLAGKLSDSAGLLYVPLLLQGLVELFVGRFIPALARPRHPVLRVSALSTAAIFASIQIDEVAACAYTGMVGGLLELMALDAVQVHHTPDPTDLVALPMVIVACWLGRDPARASARAGSRAGVHRLQFYSQVDRLTRGVTCRTCLATTH
jgi:hypothetical protein